MCNLLKYCFYFKSYVAYVVIGAHQISKCDKVELKAK